MTPAKQLALEPPPVTRRDPTYRAIVVTAKDERDPALRGRKALQTYTGKPKPPAWIICHPEMAAAIGAEVDGVMVMATGKARDVFLLGPIEV